MFTILDMIPLDVISSNHFNDQELLEIDFASHLHLKIQQQLQNHDGIFIKNCPNLQIISDVLTKRFFVRFFNRQTSTFILKIDIADFEFINPSEIQQLMEKFDKKIFLISIENSSNEKVQIFWKFQDEKIFWTQIQKEISKFVVNFLASSMRIDGHCGLSADFLSSFQSSENILEVDKLVLRNLNGLNLFMIAAERGDSNVVNFCLKSGFNVNEMLNERKAVDLAWNNQHFEIVLDLLKANSQFPVDFEVRLATAVVKKFTDMIMELQGSILDENFDNINKIMSQHPNLRHFYSTKNISAPAFALMNGKYDIYEFLIANNIYIGPNEKMDEILKQVKNKGSENVEQIHQKYLKNFKENHLMILTVNSFVGHDVPNADEKLSHVRKAFKYLDQVHPFISLILQTVAASKEFQIIFDFNRKSIQHLDPTADQEFRGMFYMSRQIYIAAGGLLNSNNVLDVYGTLIHELCHYAMLLVYNNFCRPYYESEVHAVNLYTKIAAICQAKVGGEELVKLAFSYLPEMQHAELVVRVPQLMVLFSKDKTKMEKCHQLYPDLFKYCDFCVSVDMQNHLPNIKSTAEEKVHEFRKCNKIQTKILVTLTVTLPFVVWLAILLAMPYIEPLFSCGNLTDELRSNIFESTVDFQGVNVIFGDLFGRNSSACEHLSPQEVTSMLKVFDSGKFVTTDENLKLDKVESSFNDSNPENMKKMNEDSDANSQIYIKYSKTKFREPILKVFSTFNASSFHICNHFL